MCTVLKVALSTALHNVACQHSVASMLWHPSILKEQHTTVYIITSSPMNTFLVELTRPSESCLIYLRLIVTILKLKLKQIHVEWLALDSPKYLCSSFVQILQLIFSRVSLIQRWSINEAGGENLLEPQ